MPLGPHQKERSIVVPVRVSKEEWLGAVPPQYRSLTIQDIYSEILSEIFIHSLPNRDTIPEKVPDIFEAPLLLLLVCKRWRDVALRTPALWTKIAMIQSHHSAAFIGLRSLQQWIDRAGDLPLTCHLNFSMKLPDNFNAYIDLFASYRQRWRAITIKATPSWSRGQWVSSLTTAIYERLFLSDMSSLHALDISWITDRNVHDFSLLVPELLNMSSNTPLLQLMKFYFFGPSEQLLPLNALWAQLTSLELTYRSRNPQEALHVMTSLLKHCTNLQHAFFSLEGKYTDAEDGPVIAVEPLVLPLLHTLQLDGIGSAQECAPYACLLPLLTCRHLRNFSITLADETHDNMLVICHTFLLRSGCTLEELEFQLSNRCTFDSGGILACLRQASNSLFTLLRITTDKTVSVRPVLPPTADPVTGNRGCVGVVTGHPDFHYGRLMELANEWAGVAIVHHNPGYLAD